MSTKKTALVAALVAVSTAGVVGMGAAAAETGHSSPGNLVDKIATKFNLDKGEVRTVLDEAHAERAAQREQRIEERLSQLVADGKLTEEQKAKILAKHAELKTQLEAELKTNASDKNKEQLGAQVRERQAALRDWAEANDIPLEYLHLVGGIPHHAKSPGMVVEPSSGTEATQISPRPANVQ